MLCSGLHCAYDASSFRNGLRMKIQLGSTEISLSRYLIVWSAVVLVFAAQGYFHDRLLGGRWSVVDYVRWSTIQWFAWAALAPLVFRLAASHPIQWPLRLRSLRWHVGASLGVTLLAILIGAAVSNLFEPGTFGEQVRQFLAKWPGLLQL